ncbi:MAG: hypothetical protein KGI38_00495 [Thaumarchaeota archaeon]|nr:hypothetical protein [Nitrososphaerota archaeon]
MNGGGSKAQLVQASDGKKYIIKLIGNPQQTRILANEYLVGKLAELLDVPSPAVAIVDVDQQFVSQLNAQTQSNFRSGPQFGSQYVGGDNVQVYPSTPDLMAKTNNVSKWPNAVVLDVLVQNEDLKDVHVLISIAGDKGSSEFWHVDHGHCLGVARGWGTLKSENAAVRNRLYFDLVAGADPFADVFRRLKDVTASKVGEILSQCPLGEWEVPQGDVVAIENYFESARESTQKAISLAKAQFRKWN